MVRFVHALGLVLLVVCIAGCGSLGNRNGDTRSVGETERPKIDFRQLIRFANLADAAYLGPDAIKKRYPNQPIVVRDLPQSGLRYFIRFDEQAKRQDIAIRGTSNLSNIRVDVEFALNADPKTGLHFHRGFAKAANELYADIQPHLRKGYTTTITGHSLGGAAAAILGLHLLVDQRKVRHVVTFGQPKITNVAGAKVAAGLPILRVVNRADPIAEVPPLINLVNSNWVYTHFGPEVVVAGDGTFEFSASHRAMQKAVLSFWRNLGAQSVDAHRMAAYLVALEALAKRSP